MSNDTSIVTKRKPKADSRKDKREKIRADEKQRLEHQIIQIQRVSKVVKGGKKLSFRATIAIGNRLGQVGVGIGKADNVSTAVQKAIHDGKKNMVQIPVTKNSTIQHLVVGHDGAAKVLIKPAQIGTGVIAGSSIRIVLELAGIQNILAKQLGAANLINNARATILALQSLKTIPEVTEQRGTGAIKSFLEREKVVTSFQTSY